MYDLDKINEFINYDQETGVFTWKKSKKGSGVGFVIGGKKTNGYIRFMLNGKLLLAHRVAFLLCKGYLPTNVDHINGVKHDNRLCNLRAASISENQWNRKTGKNNKSGVKGVSYLKARNKWTAAFNANGKNIFVGLFDSLTDAKLAIENAREKAHKEYCNHG